MIIKKYNLVWISDIHFSKNYDCFSIVCKDGSCNDNNKLQSYLNNTINEVISFYEDCSYIPYIIFSGDIAQEGTIEDYDMFWDMFLKRLLDRILELNLDYQPLLLFIPGNHDVNQLKSDFTKTYVSNVINIAELKYLEKIRLKSKETGLSDNDLLEVNKLITELKKSISDSNIKSDRKEFFEVEDNYKYFKQLFIDYSVWLKKISNDPVYGKFIPSNMTTKLLVSENYNESYLNGYIIDHVNQCIIILINTAWFSLGSNFTNLLVEEEFKNVNTEKSKYVKKELTNLRLSALVNATKEKLVEFNSQITGLDKIKDECNIILDSIKDYPDYFVISIMHHPLNWLNKLEYYAYDGFNENIILKQILDKSDLLLTGHEHVPNNMETQIVYKETIHYRSGQFLGDQINKNNNFNKNLNYVYSFNWFSFIRIEPLQKFIKQQRYTYNQSEEKWEYKCSNLDILPKRSIPYNLTESRLNSILESIKNKNNFDSLFSLYIMENIKSISLDNTDVSFIETDFFYILKLSNRSNAFEQNKILYFIKTVAFYEGISNTESPIYKALRESVNSFIKTNYLNFYLTCLDVLSFKDAIVFYKEIEVNRTDRQNILQEISLRADCNFDMFRYLYFDSIVADNTIIFENNTFNINNICFYNHIIPFWHYEKYFVNLMKNN